MNLVEFYSREGVEMFWDEEAARLGVDVRDAPVVEAFDPAAFGERLRRARKEAKVRQEVLAPRLGVSQPTYSRMESGRAEPTRVTSVLLERLSVELGRSMKWLLFGSPVRDRVRLAARRTDEADVRTRSARVLDLLEMDADLDDVTEFVDLAGGIRAESRWEGYVESLAHPSRSQGKRRAEELRAELDLGVDPIDDLPVVLERHFGVDVAVLNLDHGLSAVAAFDDVRHVALLAVSASDVWVRQRFSFAHELAHLIFAEGHDYDGAPGHSRSAAEVRADKFAQSFLLPEAGVRAWLTEHGYVGRKPVSFADACRLADTFGVSPQTAWIALEDIGMPPAEPAPTAATAAVVSGTLARYKDRERNCRVERVPSRIEHRVLEAFRRGFLSAESTAGVLGQDRSLLRDAALAIGTIEGADRAARTPS